MAGQDDLGPLGSGAGNTTLTEPSDFGDSAQAEYSWFKDCSNPSAGDGTDYMALWANRMMKYIRRACDGMGIARNEANTDRLLEAIQKAVAVIANVGTGFGVFKQKNPTTGIYEFYKLLAGSNITLTQVGDDIKIDGAPGDALDLGLANVGDGVEVYQGNNGVNHLLRTLRAGLGITIAVEDDDQVKISQTAGAAECLAGGVPATGQGGTFTWPQLTAVGFYEATVRDVQLSNPSLEGPCAIRLEVSGDNGATWSKILGYQGFPTGQMLAIVGNSPGQTITWTLSAKMRFGIIKQVINGVTTYHLSRAGVALDGAKLDDALAYYPSELSFSQLPRFRLAVANQDLGLGELAASLLPLVGSWGATNPTLCRLC